MAKNMSSMTQCKLFEFDSIQKGECTPINQSIQNHKHILQFCGHTRVRRGALKTFAINQVASLKVNHNDNQYSVSLCDICS